MADGPERDPTFDEVRDALLPDVPGLNKGASWGQFMAALTRGQPAAAPDISLPVVTGLSGGGVHPAVMKALAAGATDLGDVAGGLASHLPACPRCHGRHLPNDACTGEPPDPFTAGAVAGVGLAEMYADMLAAGIPLASVERILGAMLAAYAMMDKAAGE